MDKEYIDREATIEKIKQVYCTGCNSYNCVMCRACKIDNAILQIDAEPAADVAPVMHSEWDYGDEPLKPDENGNVQAFCKRCGAGDVHAKRNINKVPYCWKCGAKMDGGKNNEIF